MLLFPPLIPPCITPTFNAGVLVVPSTSNTSFPLPFVIALCFFPPGPGPGSCIVGPDDYRYYVQPLPPAREENFLALHLRTSDLSATRACWTTKLPLQDLSAAKSLDDYGLGVAVSSSERPLTLGFDAHDKNEVAVFSGTVLLLEGRGAMCWDLFHNLWLLGGRRPVVSVL